MRILPVVVAAGMLAGCGSAGVREDKFSPEAERTFRLSDALSQESRTVSALAKIEEALGAYVKTERRIPSHPEALVPKYLGEIPFIELAIEGHRESKRVEIYGSDILRGGQIDGARLKDTGRWGYVANDRQIVIFVDCTHRASRNRPWYSLRGL